MSDNNKGNSQSSSIKTTPDIVEIRHDGGRKSKPVSPTPPRTK